MMNIGVAAASAIVFGAGACIAQSEPSEDLSLDGEVLDLPDDVLFENVDGEAYAELPDILPSENGGYYPTIDETMLLGGDYPRSPIGGGFGPQNNPSDVLMQTAQGPYPYPYPGQGSRAPWAESLSPLNPYLGFFAPRQGVSVRDDGWPLGASLDLDSSFPLLVRDFSPERAMLKAGPTYFDLMFVGMTVLHSDYQGRRQFVNEGEDGWLMGIEFGLRGMVQFTDQFYLSLAATVVYLPLENDIGLRLGSGGIPTVIADFNYRFERGTWDFLVYDTVYGSIGDDLFVGLEHGALDQAGRYSFGFNDRHRGGSGYYNGDNSYLTNAIGFDASTPLGEDWRFWFSAEHKDTWRSFDFDDHFQRNSVFARLGNNGSDWYFQPGFEYYLDHTEDDNENTILKNRVYVTLKGRITENLRIEARGGYLWQDGQTVYDNGSLYSVSLFHELTRNTTQYIIAGRDYFNNDFTGQSTVAEFVRYGINHQFNRTLYGAASIQYADQKTGTSFVGQRTTVASSLRYNLFNGDRSSILLRGAYEHRNGTINGDRWLGRISYTQAFFSRTTGEIFYQYEENTAPPKFNEQVFGLTLRQYF
ncbi:MAG: hypothetical protein ACSHX9_01965 [Luteolibacter sp.]